MHTLKRGSVDTPAHSITAFQHNHIDFSAQFNQGTRSRKPCSPCANDDHYKDDPSEPLRGQRQKTLQTSFRSTPRRSLKRQPATRQRNNKVELRLQIVTT